MSDPEIPDYSGEEEIPTEDVLTRLRKMAMALLMIDSSIGELETRLEKLKKDRKRYADDMIPKLMKDSGIEKIAITSGATISLKKAIRCSLSQERKPEWKSYLEKTGNDGLILNEIIVKYGRDAAAESKTLMDHLVEIGVGDKAKIQQNETIHAQTLLAFLRREVTTHPEVLEVFGAFEQTYAEIKTE